MTKQSVSPKFVINGVWITKSNVKLQGFLYFDRNDQIQSCWLKKIQLKVFVCLKYM